MKTKCYIETIGLLFILLMPVTLFADSFAGMDELSDLLESKGAIAEIDARGAGGQTALMHAAEQGQLDAAELLISKGANVNAEDYDGITPLMFCAMLGEKDAQPFVGTPNPRGKRYRLSIN